jgi:uncharacterized repeat protein (TIGR01451 family)
VDDTVGTRTGQTRVAEYIVEAVVATIAAAALLVALVGGAANAQEARSVDLDVRKTVSPKTVEVDERQVFTVKVTNDGTTRAERVMMRDPLPSKVRFVRASTSRHVPGSCGIDDRVVTCRLGTLRADRTVTAKIHVRPVAAGSYTNRAYASFDDSGALGTGASDASDAARAVVGAAGK